MQDSQSRKPIEIKISTVVAVSAILRDSDINVLSQALREITGGVSDYFDGELAVIDIGNLDTSAQPIDWANLIELLRSFQLNPVAVRHASHEMEETIQSHGLSLDVVAKPRQTVEQEKPVVPAPPEPIVVQPAPAFPANGAMIIDTPIRAGQRIYARGADLIITASVNNGAEVIADGSIHIYAPLRGRALAGASGDANARIFAMGMEAELVSIAGIYRTFDTGFPSGLTLYPTQVRLVGDKIELSSVQPVARA